MVPVIPGGQVLAVWAPNPIKSILGPLMHNFLSSSERRSLSLQFSDNDDKGEHY